MINKFSGIIFLALILCLASSKLVEYPNDKLLITSVLILLFGIILKLFQVFRKVKVS